jgi:hypothetical protein
MTRLPQLRWTWALALVLAPSACVRRGQVCLEASHGRVAPDWARDDRVGASVCAEVEPPGPSEDE